MKIPNLYMKAVALGGSLPFSMAGKTPGNQPVTSVRKGLLEISTVHRQSPSKSKHVNPTKRLNQELLRTKATLQLHQRIGCKSINLQLDCSIVPTCAAWGSAKWDYQRPLKTVGIPTVRHQPAGPIMPFKRKFRIMCCIGGVAAMMGMAVSLK